MAHVLTVSRLARVSPRKANVGARAECEETGMQASTLTGQNGTVIVDQRGITLELRVGQTKVIAWENLAGASIKPGTWLVRPMLLVVTKKELAFMNADMRLLNRAGHAAATEHGIAVPLGEDAKWEHFKEWINQQVAARANELKSGERVLVAWSDGQKYVGSLAALEMEKVLVVFPNGTQEWVGRERVQRA